MNLTEYVYVMFSLCPGAIALDEISSGSRLVQSSASGFGCLIDDGITLTEIIRPPFSRNPTPHSSFSPL